MYRNNVLMLNLTAFSLFCAMTLVGLFLYSGTILPATQGAGQTERLLILLLWSLLIGLPLLTAVLWILRLTRKRNDSK